MVDKQFKTVRITSNLYNRIKSVLQARIQCGEPAGTASSVIGEVIKQTNMIGTVYITEDVRRKVMMGKSYDTKPHFVRVHNAQALSILDEVQNAFRTKGYNVSLDDIVLFYALMFFNGGPQLESFEVGQEMDRHYIQILSINEQFDIERYGLYVPNLKSPLGFDL